MRHSIAGVLLLAGLFVALPLRAQERFVSRFEAYAGYEYIRFNINANVPGQAPTQRFNGNGGGGELIYDLNKWLSAVGDVSGVWATNSTSAGAAIPFLFGPRVNIRPSEVTPFVQVLFGGSVTSSGIKTIGWQNHFAMTAGGGIDVRVSKHFSIRPLQVDYFLTKIPDGINNRQNNLRVGTGIVFRFD